MSTNPIIISKKPFHIKFPCGFSVYYEVIEEKKHYYGIYLNHCSQRIFKTHRENQNNACKVAKLLQEAFVEGVEYEKSE